MANGNIDVRQYAVKSNDLGIVVIGRNEGQRLIDCLSSLQQYVGRVVYVDSGSNDDSVANAEKANAIVVRLDPSIPFTAARARNEGFAKLTAMHPDCRYVQFIDGDCQLNSAWLGAALPFVASREDVAVVCGRRRERFPEKSIYNRLCDIEWDTPIGEASACGGDSLMRVNAFQAVGGFTGGLIAGEEPELCAQLRQRGWKIWRLAEEMTVHDAAMVRFDQWWRRAIRGGYGGAEVFWFPRSSSQLGPKIYRRETASAIFWCAAIPLAIVIATFVRPYLIGLAVVYPLQICRIAFRRGVWNSESWIYASFTVLGKFAALYGILKYWWRRSVRRGTELIEYKQS
jgi:glycosyltransferase involved in cell wall biosynthesis